MTFRTRLAGLGARRVVVVPVAIGLLITGLAVWAKNDALVGVGYDDALYALLARSLADGTGYELSHVPGGVPGVKYPPVYPIMLVPFWALATSPAAALQAMKLANALYIGIAAALFALLLVDLKIVRPTMAGVLAILGFAAGSMMLVSTAVLSEPLYIVVSLAALWVADAGDSEPGMGPRRALAAGALAGVAFLIRSVGITAVAAVLVSIAFRAGGKRALQGGGAAAVLAVPWVVYSATHAGAVPEVLVPRYGSYLQLYLSNISGSPGMAFDIFTTNAGAILQTLGSKLASQAGPVAQSVVGGVLVGFALLGSRGLFTNAPATSLYPWLYLSLVALWSFPPFRFVFVIFPLVLALAAVSVSLLADRVARLPALARPTSQWVRGPRVRSAVLGVGLVVLGNLAFTEVRSLWRRVWEAPQLEASAVGREVVDWVLDHTHPQAVVAFEFDPMVALYTGRHAVPNNYEPVHPWYGPPGDAAPRVAQILTEMTVDYLAVRYRVPAAAAPIDDLLGRHPDALRLIHITSSGAFVFRTNLSALAGSTGGSTEGTGGSMSSRR